MQHRTAAARPFPVEVEPPDLSPWAEGNTGVPFAWRFDSGAPGPEAMVVALAHGDELSGAIALDALLREGALQRPERGALTVAFANTAGLARWDPARPNAGFYLDRDMNRVWEAALLDDATQGGWELARARELRPLVERAGFLLDLHSTQYPAPPMLLAGRHERARRLAAAMAWPPVVISDRGGHAAGRRLRDFGPFDAPESPKTALLLEAGQHWRAATALAARKGVLRFLAALGMRGAPPRGPRAATRWLEVAETVPVAHPGFRLTIPLSSDLEFVPDAGTEIGWDGERPIRTPFGACWLLMPLRRARVGATGVRLCREVPPPPPPPVAWPAR